ncbi:hypothetical protein BDW74DRAFT_181230 [Aspergillus multicolor]|uniref:uncharacterized protein n=1 Tax=Aspergillus multicolor TaxID=41759 RepID=UPI003CCE4518
MRVPLEILRMILKYMLDILPIDEIVRATQVSTLFHDEILPMLLRSRRLSENNTLYNQWRKFPHKREFIHLRAQMHVAPRTHENACIFTLFTHHILQLPTVTILPQSDKDAIISKLIDAMPWCHCDPIALYNPRQLTRTNDLNSIFSPLVKRESFEDTLYVALTTSAIVRHDVHDLQSLLDLRGGGEQATTRRYSERLDLRPMDVAMKIGTREIVSLLVQRHYQSATNTEFNDDGVSWRNYDDTDAIRAAVEYKNKNALETFIALSPRQLGPRGIRAQVIEVLCAAIKARQLESVEFLGPYATHAPGEAAGQRPGHSRLFSTLLIRAVESGDPRLVRWCLSRPDFRVYGSDQKVYWPCSSFHPWSESAYKGPLWIAMHDCARESRSGIVRLLLQRGFDPNDCYSGVEETLLECAIARRDAETAALLVRYGAVTDVHSWRYPGLERAANHPLIRALDPRSMFAPVAQMLLDNGWSRSWEWKGKRYLVITDDKAIRHLEGVFISLGFEEEGARDENVSGNEDLARFCILVNPLNNH